MDLAGDAHSFRMLSYEWDEGEPLSARGDDSTGLLSERRNHTLLRPIYINAVEVGYAYTQCDKDKRLNVRGVTIALWYFLSRGHQEGGAPAEAGRQHKKEGVPALAGLPDL
nr:Ribonuclease ZC3H12D [Haemonchus contortus]